MIRRSKKRVIKFMDRYCKDCIYKRYEDGNTRHDWGFCTCTEIPKGEQVKLNPYRDKQFDHSDNYPAVLLSRMKPDTVPSCMIVQSFYEGDCPWYCNTYKFIVKENDQCQ